MAELPRTAVPHAVRCDLTRLSLDSTDAFLLSQVDGRTSVEDLAAVTGLALARVQQVLTRLRDAGAIALPDAARRSSRAPASVRAVPDAALIPHVLDRAKVRAHAVDAREAFVLAQLDGATSIDELVALTSISAEDIVRLLAPLVDAGALELTATRGTRSSRGRFTARPAAPGTVTDSALRPRRPTNVPASRGAGRAQAAPPANRAVPPPTSRARSTQRPPASTRGRAPRAAPPSTRGRPTKAPPATQRAASTAAFRMSERSQRATTVPAIENARRPTRRSVRIVASPAHKTLPATPATESRTSRPTRPPTTMPAIGTGAAPRSMPLISLSRSRSDAPPRSLPPVRVPRTAPPPSRAPAPPPALGPEPLKRFFADKVGKSARERAAIFAEAAETALRGGNFVGAAQNYALALQACESPELHLALADVADRARAQSAERALKSASTAEKDGNWDEAVVRYGKAYDAVPTAPVAERLAHSLRMQGADSRRAVRVAEDAARMDPLSLACRLTLGWAYADAGLWARARAEAEKAVAAAPKNATALDLLARAKAKT